MQTIDQDVRPTLAVDFGDRKSGRWHPEQRNREIARPKAPRRSVLKLDDTLCSCFLMRIQPFFTLRAGVTVSRKGQRRQDRGSLRRYRVNSIASSVNSGLT